MSVRGVSWRRRAHGTAAAVAAVALLAVAPALTVPASAAAPATVHVIARLGDDVSLSTSPRKLVRDLGGTFDADLAPVNGFAAFLPVNKVDDLRAVPGVLEVTEDVSLNWSPTDPVSTSPADASTARR